MANILKTQTYGCVCGYNQSFDSLVDPSRHMRLFPGVPVGECPSCATHPDPTQRAVRPMAEILDLDRLSTHTTLDDDDVEALTVTELNEDGFPVMVESGEVRQKLAIVDGKPAVIDEPIMVEKQRALTKQEKDDKHEQAGRNLDELEGIAVKEVAAETDKG